MTAQTAQELALSMKLMELAEEYKAASYTTMSNCLYGLLDAHKEGYDELVRQSLQMIREARQEYLAAKREDEAHDEPT